MASKNPKTQYLEKNKTTNDGYWPRFLVIEQTDDTKNFKSNANVFAVHKAIISMAGEPKSMKTIKDGNYLVEMSEKNHTQLLLKTTNLAGVPVKVSAHKALNSSRCVIYCRELDNMSELEIKDELKPQGITGVERMKKRQNGNLVPSDSYILTCKTPVIPTEIKVAYLNCKTKVYIPNPQRCFNCQKYGHSKNYCKKSPICARCGDTHNDQDCKNDPHCANCSGDHPAYFRSCPQWKTEKAILTIKFEKNISFPEARKEVERTSPDTSRNSYANVAKNQQPWSHTIRPATDFQTELHYLRYLVDYSLNRLANLEKPNVPTKENPIVSTSAQNTPTVHKQKKNAGNRCDTLDNIQTPQENPAASASATVLPQDTEQTTEMDVTSASYKRPLSADGSGSEDEPTIPNPKKFTLGTMTMTRNQNDNKKDETNPRPPRKKEDAGRSSSPTRLPHFKNEGSSDGSSVESTTADGRKGIISRVAFNRTLLVGALTNGGKPPPLSKQPISPVRSGDAKSKKK